MRVLPTTCASLWRERLVRAASSSAGAVQGAGAYGRRAGQAVCVRRPCLQDTHVGTPTPARPRTPAIVRARARYRRRHSKYFFRVPVVHRARHTQNALIVRIKQPTRSLIKLRATSASLTNRKSGVEKTRVQLRKPAQREMKLCNDRLGCSVVV